MADWWKKDPANLLMDEVIKPAGKYLGNAADNFLNNTDANRAARNAARTQAEAMQYGIDIQNQQFQQSRQDMMPWLEQGKASLGRLSDLMGQGYFDMPNRDLEGPDFQFNMQMDPGYQFRMDQATKALNRRNAARGNRLSMGSLADMTDYIGNQASNEFGNAYNRQYGQYNDQYNRRLNNYQRQAANLSDQFSRLSGMSGMGQNQASSLASLGQGYASNMGNLYGQKGAAQAGGILAQAQPTGFDQFLNQIPGLVATYYGAKYNGKYNSLHIPPVL